MRRTLVFALLSLLAIQEPLTLVCRYYCPRTASDSSATAAPCVLGHSGSSSSDSVSEWMYCFGDRPDVQALSVNSEREFSRLLPLHGFPANPVIAPPIVTASLPAAQKESLSFLFQPTITILRV
ncbi:MAG: hypothetical protein HY649_05155 [Acidobacteria bacterium]|nr:hypothetical protein [Acidobacteriota bacterium]